MAEGGINGSLERKTVVIRANIYQALTQSRHSFNSQKQQDIGSIIVMLRR